MLPAQARRRCRFVGPQIILLRRPYWHLDFCSPSAPVLSISQAKLVVFLAAVADYPPLAVLSPWHSLLSPTSHHAMAMVAPPSPTSRTIYSPPRLPPYCSVARAASTLSFTAEAVSSPSPPKKKVCLCSEPSSLIASRG
jgi:hypothetical protein